MKLFLDDKRKCPKGYKLARSAKACITLLSANKVSMLSLDYNLGAGCPTGHDVAQYIADSRKYPPFIIIHSSDKKGRIRMYDTLNLCKPSHVSIKIRPRAQFRG